MKLNLLNNNLKNLLLYGGSDSDSNSDSNSNINYILILIFVIIVFLSICIYYFIYSQPKNTTSEDQSKSVGQSNSVINYNLIDNGLLEKIYNDGDIIGSNSALISTSSEWNNGIFKASSDGIYLINASFFINAKIPGTRISLLVNNKLRYVIIEEDSQVIAGATLRTYSRVEQLYKGDTLMFKSANGFIVFFGSDDHSHSNISITKLNINNYYNLIENNGGNITYYNGGHIGSNSALISTSSEWNSNTGIFTASSDGIYLINASFYINNKSGGRVSLVLKNKTRYVIVEGKGIKGSTLRTYSIVEKLSKGDTLYFDATDGLLVFFGNDNNSHSNFTITKLNINVNNYYSLIENSVNNITYNNGDIIGSKSSLISTSSEWNRNTGIFTASSDGIYLINVSFFINGKSPSTRISLLVNNKIRYCVIEDNPNTIGGETLRTYSRVEQLNKRDTLCFKVTLGNNFIVFFGSDNSSHSNFTITKLN